MLSDRFFFLKCILNAFYIINTTCFLYIHIGPVDTTDRLEAYRRYTDRSPNNPFNKGPSPVTMTQTINNATDNATYDAGEPITFEAIRAPFSALSKKSKNAEKPQSATDNDGNNSSAINTTSLRISGNDVPDVTI